MKEFFEYHHLHIKVQTNNKLPYFAGSMLRGAFGFALKQTVCINPLFECKNCFAANNCLFYQFYETLNHSHSYRFEVELESKKFEFSLFLFGYATKQLSNVIVSLEQMMKTTGLGLKQKKYEDFSILCNGISMENKTVSDITHIKPQQFSNVPISDNFTLEFVTPLRIKSNNIFLKTTPTLAQILYSIYNRYMEISGRGRGKLPHEPSYHQRFGRTSFLDLTRYSSRQESKMQIGGIMGEIGYSGVDEESCRILRLGEIIGVGKQTVFGLGKIKIREIK